MRLADAARWPGRTIPAAGRKPWLTVHTANRPSFNVAALPYQTAASRRALPVPLPVYYPPKISRNRDAFQDLFDGSLRLKLALLCSCWCRSCSVCRSGRFGDQTRQVACQGAPQLATEPPLARFGSEEAAKIPSRALTGTGVENLSYGARLSG